MRVLRVAPVRVHQLAYTARSCGARERSAHLEHGELADVPARVVHARREGPPHDFDHVLVERAARAKRRRESLQLLAPGHPREDVSKRGSRGRARRARARHFRERACSQRCGVVEGRSTALKGQAGTDLPLSAAGRHSRKLRRRGRRLVVDSCRAPHRRVVAVATGQGNFRSRRRRRDDGLRSRARRERLRAPAAVLRLRNEVRLRRRCDVRCHHPCRHAAAVQRRELRVLRHKQTVARRLLPLLRKRRAERGRESGRGRKCGAREACRRTLDAWRENRVLRRRCRAERRR